MDGIIFIPPDILATLVDIVIDGKAVTGDRILRTGHMGKGGIKQDLIRAIVTGKDEILLLELLEKSLRIIQDDLLTGGQELITQPGCAWREERGCFTERCTKSRDHLLVSQITSG